MMHISHWREFLKLTFQALALCQSKLRKCRKYRKLKPWNRWEGKGRKGREGREGKWEHGEVKNTTRNWFNEKCSLVL